MAINTFEYDEAHACDAAHMISGANYFFKSS